MQREAHPRDPLPDRDAYAGEREGSERGGQNHWRSLVKVRRSAAVLRRSARQCSMTKKFHAMFLIGRAAAEDSRAPSLHMCAMRLSPNSEHLISVAPSMRRAKS